MFLAPVNASSELEFFRHRIHVEKDSIKRARESLRVQRSIFQGRQRTWKQQSTKASLEQLVQVRAERHFILHFLPSFKCLALLCQSWHIFFVTVVEYKLFHDLFLCCVPVDITVSVPFTLRHK